MGNWHRPMYPNWKNQVFFFLICPLSINLNKIAFCFLGEKMVQWMVAKLHFGRYRKKVEIVKSVRHMCIQLEIKNLPDSPQNWSTSLALCKCWCIVYITIQGYVLFEFPVTHQGKAYCFNHCYITIKGNILFYSIFVLKGNVYSIFCMLLMLDLWLCHMTKSLCKHQLLHTKGC